MGWLNKLVDLTGVSNDYADDYLDTHERFQAGEASADEAKWLRHQRRELPAATLDAIEERGRRRR